MAYDLSGALVVGISSRALFDLEKENEIFEKQGLSAYSEYQLAHESDILAPGAGFPLVKALLRLNALSEGGGVTEVIIMSRNSADTSLRIFNSLDHYGLDVSRAALSGGSELSPYLGAFDVDLFLSADEGDVSRAVASGVAAGRICAFGSNIDPDEEIPQIRIAFDGDAVLFSGESELVYQKEGLAAFQEHERALAKTPMNEGPFARLLTTLSFLQRRFPENGSPIRTALVTARSAPAHERVIRTLRAWDVRVDEAFFLGGVGKASILKSFGAHIFFDDQPVHAIPASMVVPSAVVPFVLS